MYRGLITDLDGTVIPVSGGAEDVDQQTKSAIAQAIQAGYKIACATGRDMALIGSLISELGFVEPCIIQGGSKIINPLDGSIIWEKALETGASQTVFQIFKKFTSDYQEAILITSLNDERPNINEVDSVPTDLTYIYLLNVEAELADKIRQEVNKTSASAAHLTPSWYGDNRFDIHVTHAQATKAHAIKVWHELVGISVDETIGMGDSGNDLPIFESSGLKVAVGNATEELKKLADYVAPSYDQGSLRHVINKFLLNQD